MMHPTIQLSYVQVLLTIRQNKFTTILREYEPKQKGSMPLTAYTLDNVAFRLWAHLGMIQGPPGYEGLK